MELGTVLITQGIGTQDLAFVRNGIGNRSVVLGQASLQHSRELLCQCFVHGTMLLSKTMVFPMIGALYGCPVSQLPPGRREADGKNRIAALRFVCRSDRRCDILASFLAAISGREKGRKSRHTALPLLYHKISGVTEQIRVFTIAFSV